MDVHFCYNSHYGQYSQNCNHVILPVSYFFVLVLCSNTFITVTTVTTVTIHRCKKVTLVTTILFLYSPYCQYCHYCDGQLGNEFLKILLNNFFPKPSQPLYQHTNKQRDKNTTAFLKLLRQAKKLKTRRGRPR